MSSGESCSSIDMRQDDKKKNQEQNNNTKKKFTLRQKLALVMLATVDFMSFCSMSIMAPFYPKEAAVKGMSGSTAGFVFGFYALIVVLSSPVFGKIMPRMGVKLVFISGILLSGLCNVIFGLINRVDDVTTFIVLSFVIRGLEALGASAYSTAGYVIIVNVFPDHAGTVRGLLETFVGLGMSAGPAIGGFLFDVISFFRQLVGTFLIFYLVCDSLSIAQKVGGFGLPFYVVGIFTIVIAPFNICLIPAFEKYTTIEQKEQKGGSFTKLLLIPSVLVTCLILMVVAATWGFLDPTLEPHLRQFNLTPKGVGCVFLLFSGTYGIFCPGWGWLSDKLDTYWWIMSVGLLCNFISLMFLGPSPAMNFLNSALWMNIVCLSTLGISVAMAQMPTYRGLLDSALQGGFVESLGTHSIIAGLWSSIYSLGEVVGPIAGGTLMDNYGFPVTSTVFAVMNLLTAILVTLFYMNRTRTNVCQVPSDNKSIIILEEKYISDNEKVKEISPELITSLSSNGKCNKL